MRTKYNILAIAVLATLAGGLAAGERAAVGSPREAADPCCLGSIQLANSFEEFVFGAGPAPNCGECDPGGRGPKAGLFSETVGRAGGWFAAVHGSQTMIGQYQDLQSAPFWDLDHLCTDGLRTDEFFATGTDPETMQAGFHYAGPSLRANVEYEGFLHRLEHDPLLNFPLAVADPANPGSYLPMPGEYVAEDLHVGQDYALRVQQLKAKFQGNVTDTVRWRLNLWGQRKSGERQANALANCFDHSQIPGPDRKCHLLSQRQEIDWLTLELEPGLEATWGPMTVSYARTLRSFNQNDQSLTRLYNAYPAILGDQAMPPQLGSENYPAGVNYPYAVVPENFTQTDKLKLGIDLTETTHLYGLLYHGTTDNQHRNTRRDFGGGDLRWTDRTIRNLTWTAYAKLNYQTDQRAAELISGEQLKFDRYDETEVPCTWSDSRAYGGCGCSPVVVPCVVGADGVPDFFASQALVQPIDYTRTTAGLNGRWNPFRTERSWRRGLSFYGGYEYRLLHREYAEFGTTLAPAVVSVYEQADTSRQLVHLGVTQKWSRRLETFVRYKPQFISQPLAGVRESNGSTNTNQPTHVSLVEIGGTWTPAASFFANATCGIENRWQHSPTADFDEQDYPLTVTAWYAATCALSFSAGYACNTNWLQQAITLGDDFNNGAAYAPVTRLWGYGGRSQVWSLGTTYAWTANLRLRGDVRYVRGQNTIDSTVFETPYVWPEIAQSARDVMQSLQLSAGCDYRLSRDLTSYIRYNYLDYQDEVRAYNNGSAHLVLAGLSGRY